MRRRFAPVMAALLLVAAGCDDSAGDGSDASGSGSGSGSDVEATTTMQPPEGGREGNGDGAVGGLADAGSLVLLDSGAEPRRELRYAIVAGATSRVQTITTIDQEIEGVAPGPITTTVELAIEVLAATADHATYTVTFGTPSVETEEGTPDAIAEAAAEGAGFLAGAVGTITMDPRGDVLEAEIDLAEEAGSSAGDVADQIIGGMLDSLQQQTVAFPAEAVGVGASWQSDLTVDAAGVRSEVQQVFTIVGIDDVGVDLTYTMTGTYRDLASGSSAGSGTMRIAFASPYPTMEGQARNEIVTGDTEVVQTITQAIRPV